MRVLATVSILSIAVLFGSCLDSTVAPPLRVRTDVIRTPIELSGNMTGILFNVPGNVFISPGPVQSIWVTTPATVARRITTDVAQGVWVVELTRNFDDLKDFTIDITIPTLEYVELRGGGQIMTDGQFDSDILRVVQDGSGVIDVDVSTRKVLADITNSGQINLRGNADVLDVNLAASGNLSAFNMPVRSASINVPKSGSGLAEVDVTDSLSVIIDGPGNVYYRGTPTVHTTITGSGLVSSVN